METRWKIGIVGVGMVGTPLRRYLEEFRGYRQGRDLFLLDKDPAKNCRDDVGKADVIFICVPTPRGPEGGASVEAVEDAFSRIGDKKIVVIKSTVPPGTTESFQHRFPHHKVLFNPEFLTERQAWEDFIRPDRQIVGFTHKSVEAAHLVLALLPKAPFMSPWGINTYKPIRITATEAEIIKYGGNVYFVRKVNLANAISALAERLGADYENVRLGMAADYRIGDSHLDVNHGGYRGVGGFCFPKDLDAFIAHLEERGLREGANLLRSDYEFNKNLLASQGLSVEDVSVHDHEWIRKKLKQLRPTAQ